MEIERDRWKSKKKRQKEKDGYRKRQMEERKKEIERERWRQKEKYGDRKREKKMLVNHFYAMNEGSSFTKTKQNNASINQKMRKDQDNYFLASPLL